MMLHTITSGPFETNAYLIGAPGSKEAVLIDAPPECFEKVDAILKSEDRTLAAVLITHPHFDHTLDASRFSEQNLPVFCHSDAVSGVNKPQTMGLIREPSGGFPEVKVTRTIAADSKLELAGLQIDCFEVPGHSAGSLAFYVQDAEVCFVGDLIFRSSVGRTDLPGGNFDVLAESIQTKIYTLADQTQLFPGHGDATYAGEEKRSNPFVRL